MCGDSLSSRTTILGVVGGQHTRTTESFLTFAKEQHLVHDSCKSHVADPADPDWQFERDSSFVVSTVQDRQLHGENRESNNFGVTLLRKRCWFSSFFCFCDSHSGSRNTKEIFMEINFLSGKCRKNTSFGTMQLA